MPPGYRPNGSAAAPATFDPTTQEARVPDILIVSDAAWVRREIRATVVDPGTTVRELTAGEQVRSAVEDRAPDLIVLDQQIGNMGAMATCMDLRLEESGGRIDHVPVLMLLDRRADVFLARQAEADGWVLKPLDPLRLRKAMVELLADRDYHDDSHRPVTVEAPAATPPADKPPADK